MGISASPIAAASLTVVADAAAAATSSAMDADAALAATSSAADPAAAATSSAARPPGSPVLRPVLRPSVTPGLAASDEAEGTGGSVRPPQFSTPLREGSAAALPRF